MKKRYVYNLTYTGTIEIEEDAEEITTEDIQQAILIDSLQIEPDTLTFAEI